MKTNREHTQNTENTNPLHTIRHRWAAIVGIAIAAVGCSSSPPPAETQSLVILHTNDIHSHLNGHSPEADYTPETTGDDATVGGLARLATAVADARRSAAAKGQPVLLLDAGDFMMGSLFELLGTTAAGELHVMQMLGYDATTIGNHELDWGPAGLAAILKAAASVGANVPIVASNMNFADGDAGDDALSQIAASGAIQHKLIKTVGNIKVGIFGLLGQDAADVTPQKAPLTFDAIAPAATAMVAELRNVDKVDLVIVLSHSGIDSNGAGEDAALAAAVPGIDVIVSGHSHAKLAAPVRIGQTVIVTAGAYGENLGELRLTVTKASTPGDPATVAVDGYDLVPIDDHLAGDSFIQDVIGGLVLGVDTALAPANLRYAEVVAQTAVDIPFPSLAEAPIGNLVTDAYRAVSASLQPTDPPVIAIEGNGQIRADIVKGQTGQIWLADLFQVVPTGIGPDAQPGYGLVTFYLNAKDIASGFELDAAPEFIGNDFFLQVSGLGVGIDSSRPAFARVTDLSLVTPTGTVTLDPADTATCYKVVTTNFVAGLLGAVSAKTGGMLQVVAKDADCATPFDPTIRFVDADPTTDGVQELKNWQALLGYVSGLGDVPAAYGAPQGRIVAR